MTSQANGQRFRVSRGGCWQCVPDCRSHLAEVLTFSQMAYNIGYTQHRPTNDSNRQQMTMRLALVPLLLLPLSMRAQTPRDSIVCFTMAEAELIHDTVWSAVNHRRARIIQAAMITNLERQLADQKLITMAERQRAENAEAVVADAVAGEQQAVKDVEFWRRKANGRGWLAFFAGLIFGGSHERTRTT